MDNFKRKELTKEEAQKAWEDGYAITYKDSRYIFIDDCPDDTRYTDFCYATNLDTFLQGKIKNRLDEPFKYYEGHGDFSIPQKKLYISNKTLWRVQNICNIGDNEILPTIAKQNNNIYEISSFKSLNTEEKHYIKNAISGKFWLHNRDQELKLGKILQNILIYPDSTKIEEYVSKWKSAYSIDTNIVKVSDDIRRVYDISNVGGSCMANKGKFMEIYEDLGCKIAYIEEDGYLRARALLWDNNLEYYYEDNDAQDGNLKYIDRIFFDNEINRLTLQKWARENGYSSLPDSTTDFVTKKSVGSYDYVPYVDNMCYVIEDSDRYRLTNCSDDYIDSLQRTDGSSGEDCGISEFRSGVWCVDIDDYVHEDDATYCESDDEYYCYTEDLCYIHGYGWYLQDDDDICYAKDIDEYKFKDDCVYIYSTNEWYYYTDGLYYAEDSEEYYSDSSDLYYTEDSGEYYENIDNVYYIQDLDVYYSGNTDLYYDEESDTYWSSEEAFLEYNKN